MKRWGLKFGRISPFVIDIRDSELCFEVCSKVDIVLHQAALGSVPRSVNDPILSNDVNVSGFLNVLNAARITGVRKFVYAASSSTYGDHPALPKVEGKIGNALSPYAVTKYANELYADVFSRTYGMSCIGLRYFNVFGERQDPSGPYSAVIPKWIASMLDEREVQINGDGSTSRDFCYIDNAVQANILAGLVSEFSGAEVFNIAFGGQTSLIELFKSIKCKLLEHGIQYEREPEYCGFREGDVLHSQADISKAKKMLNYQPKFSLDSGLTKAIPWYLKNASR